MLANRDVDTKILSLHSMSIPPWCRLSLLSLCPSHWLSRSLQCVCLSLHSIFSASPSLSLSSPHSTVPLSCVFPLSSSLLWLCVCLPMSVSVQSSRPFALLSLSYPVSSPTPQPAQEEPPQALSLRLRQRRCMADSVPGNWKSWRLSQAERNEIAEKVGEYGNGLTDVSADERAKLQEDKKAELERETKISKAQRAAEKKKPAPPLPLPRAISNGAASNGGVTPPDGGGVTPPSAAGGARHNDSTNAGYYQAVQNDIDAILRVFGPGFAAEKPLPIAAVAQARCGGVQEPYSKDAAERAIGSQGTYIASVNLLWLDMFSPPAAANVPLSRRCVIDLSTYLFDTGPTFITRRPTSSRQT